jgi:hypothetical protein
MSADTGRLMARGWQYGGRTQRQEIWQSPDGRRMWLAEALAEIEDQPPGSVSRRSEEKTTMPTPVGEIIPNLDGADELSAHNLERLLDQEYGADDKHHIRRAWRAAFERARLAGGETMRCLWNYVDHIEADRSKTLVNLLREDLGLPSLAEVEAERKLKMANATPSPLRIVTSPSGGFSLEPITDPRRQHGISATFGEIASADEREAAQRKERERREGDADRRAERLEAAERIAEVERRHAHSDLPPGFGPSR